ncbi:phosphoenolpyruvate--protein phosphotransferase [Desulfocurvibacter africanus]|uniref:Phosphoenolpyruvate-protein phosphotransferase n=2 Tax=Desulfocurvibacter africanus TaxID=873 RepID=F3Z139_DESAF|nr:phosphoenolpyruvate--protein phosphotransferase [Desulfocurvibacter africanus]EGJ49937.1 phosphoenolpyruvate-protein phosphotransferase [Desulfocurvibacter africanus subsp. africanus str. Walvis Bay]EMG36014.1 phosphoenolpyruvate-protein phosphotransferase [Desulfocurvibacter africanus PCS]
MAHKTITGIPVSAGVSIGKAFFLNRSRFRHLPRQTILDTAISGEVARLHLSFSEAEIELEAIRRKVPKELRENALIIDSHVMILKDPKLRALAEKNIRELCINAEWALEKAVSELREAFSALQDPYIRERMEDVRLVAERVQARLVGAVSDISSLQSRVVLMAHDLSPADTVDLELDKIMSFATATGAKTSHTGILARSLQIPAIVGVSDLEESVTDGDLVILDGFSGKILVDPDDEELEYYTDLKLQFEQYQKTTIRFCHLPGETRDGFQIKVLANIELFEEVAQVIDNGGEGVGLYRTEYSYMNRTELPTEEELYEEYRDLASILAPSRLTLRTLDLGADKLISHYGALDESNPALGLRAIRFCMRHPQMFKTQMRAILRAAVQGNVSLMFPMISGTQELRYAKDLLQVCKQELAIEGKEFNPDLPVGIMMEVPSAVMIAEFLAKEVDFFSIGTNDLIQYSLGIDRTNRHVSHLYQPLHPAIVRMIKYVVDAGHQAGIEVSVCGEMAADPFCVPILMGMQVDCISLGPQAIPGIKRIIRRANLQDCKQLLKDVLQSSTVTLTNRLVRETIFKSFPEELTFYTSLLDND